MVEIANIYQLVLKKEATDITEYLANFVYEDGVLDFILTDEGRVVLTSEGKYQYEYFLKDHLGNTRVNFYNNNGVADLLEGTDYYPFGLSFATAIDEGANKYLYNGKELQDDDLGNGVKLGWYDYGARMYDPSGVFFTTQGPMAESYDHLSPYGYCAGNPIKNIDVNGEWIWAAAGGVTGYGF